MVSLYVTRRSLCGQSLCQGLCVVSLCVARGSLSLCGQSLCDYKVSVVSLCVARRSL